MACYAIILGGGRSERMGRDKRALVLGGRSMLARAVLACAVRDRVVVVSPDLPTDVAASRVILTLEDPPYGGPVAGIAAGLAALGPARPDDEVLLLACDLPQVADVVAALDAVPMGPDGVCLLDAEAYPQYLAGRYRHRALSRALAAVVDTRGVSVRRLMAGLDLAQVPAAAITRDVDTPADAREAGIDPEG